MTALCGSFAPAHPNQLEADCAKMLGALQAYGSSNPRIGRVKRAAFGIDLYETLPEDAFDRQPLLIDGHLLVADVRLDNRDELARSLGSTSDLRAAADSELLLRSWLRWGESCLDRIIGDYAFAVYEIGKRRLTLARDCIGQRPLFFAQQGDSVAFASMLSGLLALPRYRQGLNYEALALAAADVPLDDDSTYFQSIHRVLPGQLVTFSPEGRREWTYWQPSLDELKLKKPEDYVDAYRNVLDEAVRPRLRRVSGPIATHLSSGLDSSAVAATAARLKQAGEPIIAFTAAPGPEFREPFLRGRLADERAMAARTARMHAMEHEVVRTTGSGLAHIRGLVATSQEPSCNIVNLDWFWSIERLARDKGARILLSGEYGNLTLNAGGLTVLADLISRNRWAKWWKEARFASMHGDARLRGILLNSFEPWMPQAARRALYRLFLGCEPRSRSVFLKDSWIRALGRRIETGFLPNRSGDSYEDRLRTLRLFDGGALQKGSLARHGIDNRSPLSDRRIIEFSLRLPPEQLISRPLARRALSDRVPRDVLDARARGYQSADWFEHVDLDEMHSMLDEIAASPAACELIDPAKIRHALAYWPTAGVDDLGRYQRLAVDLPKALATGFFILEAERWMSARAPAPARSGPAGGRGPTAEPG